MLDRLVGKEYYYFLDTIVPEDQSETTFTCPYDTFAFRQMLFGLCTLATFQRCVIEIFSNMVDCTIEVFMDDFFIHGESFQICLKDLEQLFERYEETHFILTRRIVTSS